MKRLKLNLQSIENDVEISDGYHTFDELYDHRITLYIALCKSIQDWVYLSGVRNMAPDGYDKKVWRSTIHSDGSNYDGWFLLGINRKKGEQITYHIPLSRWDETDFAQTLKKAPKFDGHTSTDVLERIKKLNLCPIKTLQ